MKSGPLCALLWRILTWCTRKYVTLKARHTSGLLNMIAEKLSRLGQTIQTEWSPLPEVFQTICNWWHQPQVDLFATRFNNKLPQFVTGPRPPDQGSGFAQPLLGRSGPICLPTSHPGQSGGELAGLPMQQDHTDCTRVATCLGFGPIGEERRSSGNSHRKPGRFHPYTSSTCLAPRATAIKGQGF